MNTFNKYDLDETKRIAKDFVNFFLERSDYFNEASIETRAWTETVLDYFAATKESKEVVVDARRSRRHINGRGKIVIDKKLEEIAPNPRTTEGEYLFDLTHTRFEPYGDHYNGSYEYWQRSFSKDKSPELLPELLLALESEWGKSNDANTNLRYVMEDASKLFPVAARVKTVVFGSVQKDNRKEIIDLLGKMRDCDYTKTREGKDPIWLWIDIPWPKWEDSDGPCAWLDGDVICPI